VVEEGCYLARTTESQTTTSICTVVQKLFHGPPTDAKLLRVMKREERGGKGKKRGRKVVAHTSQFTAANNLMTGIRKVLKKNTSSNLMRLSP
jgi:hypothetical protein